MAEIEVFHEKAKTVPPKPSKHTRQRSFTPAPFLIRYLPNWSQPDWYKAEVWRRVVANQPIATLCKDTQISNLIALDWQIEPRDSTQRDELKSDIDYYTRFFEYTGEYDFLEIIEHVGSDFLDLPFGGAVEVGRENDDPKGKVLWIELLDGATLFPSLNFDWPVGQYVKDVATAKQPIYFPWYAINRVYMSPRTKIERKGWGMPPPEKIYLALEMIRRGDMYYANLLLDTPEAGILDLGDMEEQAAKTWVESWQTLLAGIDPFKVPVLYEHTSDAKFISFSRSPQEMSFDKAILKYAAIVCAGYGMSLSDIGMQAATASGETLAGSIRQERRTRRTGFARIKKKFKYFFDRLLPENLQFKWIDLDDELNVALGRARLASATSFGQLIDKQIITPKESRQQMVADGLISIPIPEEIPEEDMVSVNGGSPERPGMLGAPEKPSLGGHGEIVPKSIVEAERYMSQIEGAIPDVVNYINSIVSTLEGNELDQWDGNFTDMMFEDKFPEGWEIDIEIIKNLSVPKSLVDSVSNAPSIIKKLIIMAIREKILQKYSESLYKGLDTQEILVDNELKQRIMRELSNYLDDFTLAIQEKLDA